MKFFTVLLAGLGLVLAGCATTPTTESTATSTPTASPAGPSNGQSKAKARLQMATLQRFDWQLQRAKNQDGERIDALFARPDKPLTLGFQDGRIHVANACNVLNGNVKLADGKLEVLQMISTMMACGDPAVAALDKAISSRLESPAYRLDDMIAPPRLLLTTENGDTLVFLGTPKQDADSANQPDRD